MSNLIFYSHTDCLLKDNGHHHPERRERLETIIESINEISDIRIDKKNASIACLKTINLVHPENYVRKMLSKIPNRGLITVEEEPYADTFLCSNSKNVILRSCGAGGINAEIKI